MPTAEHHRARIIGTIGAAAAHGYLGVLGFVDLLNFTVPSRYLLLEQVTEHPGWAWAHMAIAVLLIVALWIPYWQWRTGGMRFATLVCTWGFAVMGTWGFFHLLWGMSTVRPVSLVGPGLALVVAAGEHLLANAWARGTHTKGR